MPVPSAVTQRRERDEAALRAQGINPASGAPIDVQVDTPSSPPATVVPPAPAPASVAPPTPSSDEASELRRKLAEAEEALRTQNGRASTLSQELEETKRLSQVTNDNRSFLETKLTDQATELAALRKQLEDVTSQQQSDTVTKLAATLDDSGPTPEQVKEFGVDSQDFITRIVKQQLAGVIKPLVERFGSLEKAIGKVNAIEGAIPPLQSAAQESNRNVLRMKELEFVQKEILPYFKDFDVVRTSPEWQTYLQTQTPHGYTNGKLLQHYRATSNAEGLRTLIGAFYQARTPVPKLDDLTVPAKTGADAPEPPPPQKIKASEYNAKLRMLTSKKLSKEDWEAFRTRWDKAYAAGDIEMDAELR